MTKKKKKLPFYYELGDEQIFITKTHYGKFRCENEREDAKGRDKGREDGKGRDKGREDGKGRDKGREDGKGRDKGREDGKGRDNRREVGKGCENNETGKDLKKDRRVCNHYWESAHVYVKFITKETKKDKGLPIFYNQECATCDTPCQPFYVERIRCRYCRRLKCQPGCKRFTLRHNDPKKPHHDDKCEKCQAGKPCVAKLKHH